MLNQLNPQRQTVADEAMAYQRALAIKHLCSAHRPEWSLFAAESPEHCLCAGCKHVNSVHGMRLRLRRVFQTILQFFKQQVVNRVDRLWASLRLARQQKCRKNMQGH